jgi:hypothetical protein
MKLKSIVAFALVSLAVVAHADTYSMDFDTDADGNSISDGDTLGGQYSSWGVDWFANAFVPGDFPEYLPPNGFDWASNAGLTMTSTDIGGGVSGSSGNLLHSFDDWLSEDGNATLFFLYDGSQGAMDSASASFHGSAFGDSIMLAFHHDGGGIYSLLGDSGWNFDDANYTLSVGGFGQSIDAIVFVTGAFDDWVGIDNVSFHTEAVPEPATLAALGIGAAAMLRRRRKVS